MLVYTGSLVGDRTEVLCSVCLQVVGAFTPREISDLLHNLDAIYCFECDSVNADKVHPSLLGEDEPYFLRIGREWVSVNIWQEVRAKDVIINQRDNQIADLFNRLTLATRR